MQERPFTDITTQYLTFMRDTFQMAIEATTTFQEQTLKFFDDLTKRGTLTRQESQKLLEDWLKASLESIEAFQKHAQENFTRWEEDLKRSFKALTPASKQDVEELSGKLEELIRKVEALSHPS